MTPGATPPRITLGDSERLLEPPGTGVGHWAGACCAHRHEGRTYLAVRWRDPDRRGYAVDVYERRPAGELAREVRLTAAELGVVSVERPALLTDPASGDLKLYLPVEHGENDWTIRKLDDVAQPSAFDPGTARDVLVPAAGATDAETVKDPHVVTVDGEYYMFYAGHDGRSEQAHLATSADGNTWTRVDVNPVLGRSGWHDHHTRVSCVVRAPAGTGWYVFYDGSGTADHAATWNLRTGAAVATELSRPTDATPEGPLLSAPHAAAGAPVDDYATCRYIDLLTDGRTGDLYAEVARPDGAFELRRYDVTLE